MESESAVSFGRSWYVSDADMELVQAVKGLQLDPGSPVPLCGNCEVLSYLVRRGALSLLEDPAVPADVGESVLEGFDRMAELEAVEASWYAS
jgi:hypothetical protein